jgi:hypothetical protein
MAGFPGLLAFIEQPQASQMTSVAVIAGRRRAIPTNSSSFGRDRHVQAERESTYFMACSS